MKSENRFSTIISRGSLLTLAGIIHPSGLDSAEKEREQLEIPKH